MKCLHPVTAWQCGFTFAKADGVISPRLVFSYNDAVAYHAVCGTNLDEAVVSLPCGHCDACLLQKRKDMTTRLCHEASMHECATFLTLTYSDDFVPTTDSLVLGHTDKVFSRGSHDGVFDIFAGSELPHLTLLPSDVQKFMKRLRRHLEYVPKRCHVEKLDDGREVVRDSDGSFVRDHAKDIRYFAVGEYGSKTHRPHYHILIFGWQPSDVSPLCVRRGNLICVSEQVSKLWRYGFNTVSSVSPKVCRYCARYVTKKFVSMRQLDNRIVPEFTLQSVKDGGIGAKWFMRYGEDAVRRGFCTYRSAENFLKVRVPPYYLTLCRKHFRSLWLDVRNERIDFIRAYKGAPVDFGALRREVDVARDKQRKLCQDDLL